MDDHVDDSDAIPEKTFIHRLKEDAYSDEKIGTVTPISNNTEICSFPNFMDSNKKEFTESILNRLTVLL